MQYCLIREFKLNELELGHKTVEVIKNICVKGESAIEGSWNFARVTRPSTIKQG